MGQAGVIAGGISMGRRQAMGIGGLAVAGLASMRTAGEKAGRNAGSAASGQLRWRCQPGRAAGLGLVAADGVVYLSDSAAGKPAGWANIWAIDAGTGRPIWHQAEAVGYYNDGNGGLGGAGGGAVYLLGTAPGLVGNPPDGHMQIQALSAASGQTLWTYSPADPGGWGEGTWLGFADGTVFSWVSPHGDGVSAVDARTGRLAWSVPGSLDGASDPVVADGLLFTGSDSGQVCAWDAAGRRLWEAAGLGYRVDDLFVTAGAVCADVVTSGTEGGYVFGLDEPTGRLLWRAQVPEAPVAATGGMVCCVQLDEQFFETGQLVIRARCARSGRQAWTRALPGANLLATGEGTLCVADTDGGILAINAATGRTSWHVRLAYTAVGLTTAEGTLYAADLSGTVYALAL
jgi:outer membrane protein assembly factor BamB